MLQSVIRSRHGEELIWLLPLVAATLLLFVSGHIIGSSHGISAFALLEDYGWKALRALPTLLEIGLIVLLVRAWSIGGPSPLRSVFVPLRGRLNSPMLIAAAVAPLILMPLMFSGFGILKMVMPAYAAFSWDDSFAAADRMLFFGRQPWTLTHAVLSHPLGTWIVDRIYTYWVPLLSVAIVVFSLFMPRYDRARFFLSFGAAWLLLGVAGAYLTSSAGPCYTGQIGVASAAEFESLMANLRGISTGYGRLGAVEWQDVLWNAHANREYGFGMGISAMPSLHNAIAVLYALAFGRYGRPAAIAGWIYAAVILFGSVHLGWHYAVDGIVAGGAMVGIWWAAGRYLQSSGYSELVTGQSRDEAASPAAPALA